MFKFCVGSVNSAFAPSGLDQINLYDRSLAERLRFWSRIRRTSVLQSGAMVSAVSQQSSLAMTI